MITIGVIALLFHILASAVAVGSVTVTDYLHLVGLKRKKLEKKLMDIYPLLSNIINISIGVIFLSGIILVITKPELLSSSLFRLKMSLVILVTLNGIYLQRKVTPNLTVCVTKGRKHCSKNMLYSAAVSGSISIVTWYSIMILALTKTIGYTLNQFLVAYLSVLSLAIVLAIFFEKKAIKWHG